MVSDVLFEAVAEIDEYLENAASLYRGEIREKILKLREHMEEVRALLDAPPGTFRESVEQNNA